MMHKLCLTEEQVKSLILSVHYSQVISGMQDTGDPEQEAKDTKILESVMNKLKSLDVSVDLPVFRM